MIGYIKIDSKLSPIHERPVGQFIKLTIRTYIDNNDEVKPDFRHYLYYSEFDSNFENEKVKIQQLIKKYRITQLILI